MIKAKESEGKHSFGKNIIFEIVPTIFLILINILFALFSYFVLLIFAGGTSLPLISFVRRLISTSLIPPKRTQVVQVNKGNDKIVITQSTHDAATGPMTRSKAKSTSSLSTKQTSESTCLLKLVRTRDEY